MEKNNQVVQWDLGGGNNGTVRGQTIKRIVVDEENYAYGLWGERFVASFHIDNGEWHVIPVSEEQKALLVDAD